MALQSELWYFSSMNNESNIPSFGLFGEQQPFPDVIHCEAFSDRAPLFDWHIVPHRHAQMSQFFVISEGHVSATADGKTWELSSGQYLYVPELCVHQFQFEPGTNGSVFSFPNSVVNSMGPNGGELLAVISKPFTGALCDHLRTLTDMLRTVSEQSQTFRSQLAVALSHSILALIAETERPNIQSTDGQITSRMAELDLLVAQHAAQGWSASDYAAALAVSTGHLSRLCRQASGLGAAAYIEQKVMVEACRLLAFTQLPISEIGYRLGFADPSYFSKRFKRAQGQAPSEYRSIFMG